MNTTTLTNATEYRDLHLAMLTESTTNPRRLFEENALKELAETIRSQGVLSPLLVRPTNERTFEIVFGARRYRAAQLAEVATVPVRIKNLILLAVSRQNGTSVLRDAATLYKVDTDAIASKVKQEFAAKAKAKKEAKPVLKAKKAA